MGGRLYTELASIHLLSTRKLVYNLQMILNVKAVIRAYLAVYNNHTMHHGDKPLLQNIKAAHLRKWKADLAAKTRCK
jgi:hypothetical protein